MFYNKDEYKKLLSLFFSKNGIIIKLINPNNGKNIGNLFRYELENTNDDATILVNVSLFDSDEDFKKYSLKNLKYFGIKHSFKKEIDIKKFEKFILNEIDFEEKLNSYLMINKTTNINVISFIIEKIKNTKKYYKNKKIIAYFI